MDQLQVKAFSMRFDAGSQSRRSSEGFALKGLVGGPAPGYKSMVLVCNNNAVRTSVCLASFPE